MSIRVIKKTDEFNGDIELYHQRKITRQQIIDKYNIDNKNLNNYLYKNKIIIWDSRRFYIEENINEIIQLYNAKKMTRRELANKYNITHKSVTSMLKYRGIDLWDLESKAHVKKKKKYNSKYFNYKDFNQYGRMILSYND